MGLSGSRLEEEDVHCNDSTPIKFEAPRRQLDIDPRSPSAEIARTPIVVNKTPETLLDPRSPTHGIIRTPITSQFNQGQSLINVYEEQKTDAEIKYADNSLCFSDVYDVSENSTLLNVAKKNKNVPIPVLDNHGLDMSGDIDQDKPDVMTEFHNQPLLDMSLARPESDLHDFSQVNPGKTEIIAELQNLSEVDQGRASVMSDLLNLSEIFQSETGVKTELQDLSDVSQSEIGVRAELQNLSLSDTDEASSLLSSKVNDKKLSSSKKTKNSSKIPRPCQPKKLFTEKRKFDVTRSPLSTVIIDTNSPRNIMQRKQAKKVDIARQCGLEASGPSDKENVMF